jgi:hypothetical protein
MVYLAYYCSHTRKQAVSFYFTITFSAGWFVLDTARRSTAALWNHPQMKFDFFFGYI